MTRTTPGISSPEAEFHRTGCDIHRKKWQRMPFIGQLKILPHHFNLLKISG